MNFGLFFANAGPFAQTETFEALVRKSDEVGIESLWAIEHVVIPVNYQSEYPYAKGGRNPDEIELTASATATDLDTIRRYQDIGVSRLVISPPGFDPDGIARGLEAFGNDVLAKL
jgi:hypothetical protein